MKRIREEFLLTSEIKRRFVIIHVISFVYRMVHFAPEKTDISSFNLIVKLILLINSVHFL